MKSTSIAVLAFICLYDLYCLFSEIPTDEPSKSKYLPNPFSQACYIRFIYESIL